MILLTRFGFKKLFYLLYIFIYSLIYSIFKFFIDRTIYYRVPICACL